MGNNCLCFPGQAEVCCITCVMYDIYMTYICYIHHTHCTEQLFARPRPACSDCSAMGLSASVPWHCLVWDSPAQGFPKLRQTHPSAAAPDPS